MSRPTPDVDITKNPILIYFTFVEPTPPPRKIADQDTSLRIRKILYNPSDISSTLSYVKVWRALEVLVRSTNRFPALSEDEDASNPILNRPASAVNS